MKILITFLLLFIAKISFAQEWQMIPKTNISYSNFKYEKEKGIDYYQYFKKGDSLIVFPDSIASIFYDFFKVNSKIFSEIYALGYFVTRGKLYEKALHFDKKVLSINNYKSLVVFFILR